MKKINLNANRSLQFEGFRVCERCGKLTWQVHLLISSNDLRLRCVCDDDRQCREPQQSRKQKQLQRLKERWAYEK